MTCPSCTGEVYQFQPGPTIVGVAAATLPQVCQRCGEVRIDGKVVEFPAAFKDKLASMAEEAARVGLETKDAITRDPEARIESYFANVYKTGYMHGFFRALAFWKQVAKEGRLVRLRKLWLSFRKDLPKGGASVTVFMDGALYTEFDRLLMMSKTPFDETNDA